VDHQQRNVIQQHTHPASDEFRNMRDIEDFTSVFSDLRYSNERVSRILENKKALGGKTFFERLLELLHIKCVSRQNVVTLRAADPF
jgi:hypothetical protein